MLGFGEKLLKLAIGSFIMKKSVELYVLIHSLSKSEKRYFRLFCGRESSGGNYLRLFEAIDKQEEYDERKIKEEFAGETFTKQLHVTKNYLRNLILKSLRNFHGKISKSAELKDLLRNVELLYFKELFGLCEGELLRAEKIAHSYELTAGLVEVLAWKRRLGQARDPQGHEALKAALAQERTAIATLENTNANWEIGLKVMEKFGKDYGKKGIEFPGGDTTPETLEAKSLYYNAAYLHYLGRSQPEKAEEQLRYLLQLLSEQPHRIKEDPGLYASTINNLLAFLNFRQRHAESLALIQEAKEIYGQWGLSSENVRVQKATLRTFNIELEIYRDMRAFEGNVEFIHSTETFVRDNRHKIPKDYLLSFWFQLASIQFMQKDYSASLHWINQLLNARYKDVRLDLQLQARMLNLMVHLEQQNLFVLRYFVDSTKRFMKKVKETQPFEEALLRFFIRIGRIPLLEYRDAFRELKEELFPEEGESLVPVEIVGYIDYRSWIEERVGEH